MNLLLLILTQNVDFFNRGEPDPTVHTTENTTTALDLTATSTIL